MGTIRVLHVDDEPRFGGLVSEFLERADDRIEVVTETSADDGLSRIDADEERIDCIVSDYDMPGLDGLEFVDRVRDDYPDLPFILYTGKGSEEVASEAMSKGVTDYLQKGSGTEQYELLANRVRNATEQYRSTQAAKQTRRRLQNLAESTSDCVWMFDRDWEELLFISGYEDVWNRPTEAIRDDPQDFLHGVHPEDREYVRDAMARMSDGESINIEYRIRRGDDESGWVWVQGEPAYDDDGRVKSVVGFTQDITARKQREQRLERYERIVENLPVGVFRTTLDGEFVSMNERFVSLFAGDAKQDFESITTEALYADAADRERLLRRLDQAGAVEDYQLKLQTLDGAVKSVETTIRLVEEDGERYLDGIVQDVTDREERRLQLEQAETIFESTQDSLFLVDVADEDEFTVERVNPAYEEATGLTADALVGQTPRDILGDRQGAEVERKYRECVDQRTAIEYEETLLIDGDKTHWDTRIAPIEIDGTVEKLVGATRNITGRKEHKQALREEREFIEQSLNALDDVFYVFSADGDVLRWNDRLSEVTGYSEAETAGMEPTDFFPANHQPRIADAVTEVMETGSTTVQADFLTTDGERIPHEFTGFRLTDPDGGVLGFAGIGRDLRRQREYERQLEQRNDRLEAFASIVSHDLRSPLGVADGRLALAREDCESEHLEQVKQALDRMDALIEDLLTLAREGQSVTDVEPVELAAVAEACWATVETADATLVVDGDRTIHADESRLKQVFENLVRNAVDHSDEAVTVTVGALDDGFYVEDDGPGIPAGEREAVFDVGYSTSDEGIGFGLSIAEQVADAHGWTVSVTDGSEGGARFEFTGVEDAG